MTCDIPRFDGSLDADLVNFIQANLTEARRFQQDLEQAKLNVAEELIKVNQYVIDCETKLQALTPNPSEKLGHSLSVPAPSDAAASYNPGWSYTDKIRYVLRNPLKYGFTTFKGVSSIAKAILTEQPDFKHSERAATIQLAPQVSRIVKNGYAIKVLAINSVSEYHFISADWFDGNAIKPQHQEAVGGLDLAGTKGG